MLQLGWQLPTLPLGSRAFALKRLKVALTLLNFNVSAHG